VSVTKDATPARGECQRRVIGGRGRCRVRVYVGFPAASPFVKKKANVRKKKWINQSDSVVSTGWGGGGRTLIKHDDN